MIGYYKPTHKLAWAKTLVFGRKARKGQGFGAGPCPKKLMNPSVQAERPTASAVRVFIIVLIFVFYLKNSSFFYFN